MSYHLTRLRLIETAYQVIYIMNHSPHPPYEAILKVDQEFTDIEKTVRLSPFFPSRLDRSNLTSSDALPL